MLPPPLAIVARATRAAPPRAARRPAAHRRRHDAGRGVHRRRARRQGVRAGGRQLARFAGAPSASSSASSTRRASRRATARCSTSSAARVRRDHPRRRPARDRRELTLGGFFAYNLYLLLLIWPLRMIGMWIGQYQRAVASGERIFQVLDARARHHRCARRRAAPRRRRRAPLRGRHVRLRRRPARAARPRSRHRARQHRRPDRPTGLGQDDAHLADPALLRLAGRPRAARRRGRARPALAVAARGDRDRQRGHVPVLDDRGREHRLRRARGDARADRAGRPRRRRRTSSSSDCPKATTRSSASAA